MIAPCWAGTSAGGSAAPVATVSSLSAAAPAVPAAPPAGLCHHAHNTRAQGSQCAGSTAAPGPAGAGAHRAGAGVGLELGHAGGPAPGPPAQVVQRLQVEVHRDPARRPRQQWRPSAQRGCSARLPSTVHSPATCTQCPSFSIILLFYSPILLSSTPKSRCPQYCEYWCQCRYQRYCSRAWGPSGRWGCYSPQWGYYQGFDYACTYNMCCMMYCMIDIYVTSLASALTANVLYAHIACQQIQNSRCPTDSCPMYCVLPSRSWLTGIPPKYA